MTLTSWKQLRSRWWISWPLEVVFIFVVIWSITAWQTRDLLPTRGDIEIPNFELLTLDGHIYPLLNTQSKLTLLYFFAPWCKICHLSISNLEKLRQVRPPQELTILLIALSWQEVAEVKAFMAKHQLTLPVLLGTAKVAKAYRIKGFPTYYVINAQGQVIDKSMGYSTEWGLRWRTY